MNILELKSQAKPNGKITRKIKNPEAILLSEFHDLRRSDDDNKPRLLLFGKETKPVRSTRTLLDFRFQSEASMKPRLFFFGKPNYENVDEVVKEPLSRKRSRRS